MRPEGNPCPASGATRPDPLFRGYLPRCRGRRTYDRLWCGTGGAGKEQGSRAGAAKR
nr:hypothetical protein GCM10010200_102350 [Actinomadura rugatobispora]